MNRIEMILFSVGGGLILSALILVAVNINYAQVAQALLILAVIIVIYIYTQRAIDIAKATREQTEISNKMAKEMENQRHDTVRPLIDIAMIPLDKMSLAQQIYMPMGQLKLPYNILCKLRNIGIGPAVDVYYYTSQENENKEKRELGVIKINEETDDLMLYVEQGKEESLLEVYYKDLYGRTFKSSRIAFITEEKIYKLGRFDTAQVQEEEKHD